MLKPYFERGKIRIYHGNSLELLPQLEDRFDSVVTDPPYHLTTVSRGGSPRINDPETPFGRTNIGAKGFMGKTWDGGDVAMRPETWKCFLDACKPGGSLLSFGGSRTFHRMFCAIEDGGWMLKDCLNWMYGSGFPKSLDISKSMDKAAGAEREVVGTKRGKGGQNLNQLARDGAGDDPDARGCGAFGAGAKQIDIDIPVTVPFTPEAKLWDGWGTALKPSWEPICLAMKHNDGTYAENAIKHGVAGLNIDACRIELNGDYKSATNGRPSQTGLGDNYDPEKENHPSTVGRFPANTVLTHHSDCGETCHAECPVFMLNEQSGITTSGAMKTEVGSYDGTSNTNFIRGRSGPSNQRGDTGGASRFFYCSKASRSERGDTNRHPTVKPIELMTWLCKLTSTPTGGILLDPFMGSGTTLLAAINCGRAAVGIELEEENCAIAAKRIEEFSGLF